MSVKYQSNIPATKKAMENAFLKSLNEMGILLETSSKLRCPVKTGKLRRSITHKTGKDHVTVGTNVDYAPTVHNGSSRQRAQPFIKDAINEDIKKLEAILIKNMGGLK